MLDDGAPPITLGELREGRLSDARRIPRRRRVVVAIAATVVLACAVAGFVALSTGSDENRGQVSSASDLTTFVNPSRKVSLQYPAGWQVASKVLTPALGVPGKPYEVAALGTFPLVPSDHNCAQVPVNALEDMTSTDTFVWIGERADLPAGTYPPRPATMTPADGIEATSPSVYDTPPAGCLEHQLAGTLRTFHFQDNGRTLYALVALGTNASPERIAQAYDVLNSLTVG